MKRRTEEQKQVKLITDEEPEEYEDPVEDAIREWKHNVDNEMLGLVQGTYEYSDTWKRLFKQYRKIKDVITHLNIKYPKPKKPFLREWVKDINNALGGKLNKVLIILKYLSDNALSPSKGRGLVNKHKTDSKWRNSVIFYCEDFEEMSENLLVDGLDIQPEQIHRYLRWLTKYQFIFVISQTGQRGHNIYSIGYWFTYEDKDKIEKPGRHLWFQRIHKDKNKKDFTWRNHYTDALRNFKQTFSQTQ